MKAIARFLHWFSYIGIAPDSTHPDKKNIVLGNQAVFALTVTFSLFAVVLWQAGLGHVSALLLLVIGTFVVLTSFIYAGWYMTGRVLGITTQNINVFLLAVFLGYETRVIDFLIITTVIPLVLFNMSQKKWIAFCVSQNILLYAAYHLFKSQLEGYGISEADQLLLYNLCIPVKFINILVAVFIIINKRTEEEQYLKNAVTELERVNEGLRQFAYVTSHDLKTPLRNISTYLQLLKRKNQLDSESVEMVDSAVKSVKQLNQLITDIFLYTTTDFKNEKDEWVDLSELLQQIKADTAAIFSEQHGQLLLPGQLPKIKMNATQALQVFSNLIGNAIKYNRSHAPIVKLSCHTDDQYHTFTVTDNGIGIEEKYQHQIFELFKRLHTKEEYEGTGIGLAMCKKIIESHGGTIRVESTPGKGSSFIFTIPV
ncbi:MAG: GHKL domain-containing protein [Bacteroidetes bacterium]|nr:GHKL domain-containing protein [Bacteroidota bacterium]